MLTVDGLASGLDTSGLIEQLLALQRRPIALLQDQITTANQRQTAFLDVTARVLSLQTTVARLAEGTTFNSVAASSSNESLLAASVSTGVPPGVYSFRVGQLASPSQYASNGFSDADQTPVGAGTLSLEYGGFVDVETELAELNGGEGVTRGKFRITDQDGNSAVIDAGSAVSLRDIIETINDTPGLDVTASVADQSQTNTGRALVLTDTSGGSGTLTVEEVGGTDTASDLGILGSIAAASGTTLEGSAIRVMGTATRLSSLMDGLGARGTAGDDLRISGGGLAGDITIDIDSLTTVGELVAAVNEHANNGGAVTMSISASGDRFEFASSGALTITNESGASAATDLGIEITNAGASFSGNSVLSGIDDMFVATLNGGLDFQSVNLGEVTIQNRASMSGVAIDLSGAESIQDVIRTINAAGIDVTATVNKKGNGLLLTDNSGGTGDLIVTESGLGPATNTAAQLGILGSTSSNKLKGSDLDPRYVHANTLLSDLNGGGGVASGSIRITSTNGATVTVNLANADTMADVVRNIQGQASALMPGLDVDYNDDGNGLILTDTSGLGTLRIDEVGGGTTARDLHLLGIGDPDPTVIDGSFEETITIDADDTLQDVLDAIQALNIDVTAAVLNDGSAAGNRLSVIGNQSGSQGRLLVGTTGGTSLSFDRTAESRDGILFYGETSGSSESILLRSSSNTYTDIIEGLTVTALGTSSEPVRVTVNRDHETLRQRVQKFVDDFNTIVDTIGDLTDYDVETERRGLLLGDGALRNAERLLFNGAIRPLNGVDGGYQLLSEVGIRVSNGRLTFNSGDFDDALAADPNAIESLFTASRLLEDRTELADFNNGSGVEVDNVGTDLEIQLRDGTSFEVDLDGATFVEDVIDAINAAATAAGASFTAELSSSSRSFVLRDGSTGTSTFRVSTANGSRAASDLGLNRSADATGGAVLTSQEIDLTDDPGVAARLVDVIESLTDAEDGALQRRADRFDQVIANLEGRIDALTARIGNREEQLRRQFAQLEQIIQTSQNTQQRLSAQLSGLSG